jgi:hypothetical protein
VLIDQGFLTTNAPEPMTLDFSGSLQPVFAVGGLFLNTDINFNFEDGELTFELTPSYGPAAVVSASEPTFVGFLSDVPILSVVIYPTFEAFEYEDPFNPGVMITENFYFSYPSADELIIGDTTGAGWAPIPEPGTALIYVLLATCAIPASTSFARRHARRID